MEEKRRWRYSFILINTWELKHILEWRMSTRSYMLPLLLGFGSSPKAGKLLFLYWWLVIMEVLASEWVRRKMLNFWLLSVVEEHLCLSSLMKFEGLGKRASIMNLKKKWNCAQRKCSLGVPHWGKVTNGLQVLHSKLCLSPRPLLHPAC